MFVHAYLATLYPPIDSYHYEMICLPNDQAMERF
jgi:hypothetical protein